MTPEEIEAAKAVGKAVKDNATKAGMIKIGPNTYVQQGSKESKGDGKKS